MSVSQHPPPCGDWHPEDIKAAIRKRGKTLRSLATSNGYDHTACRKTLKDPWPAIERIIADYLAVTPQTIWPSRYDARGKSLTRRKSRAPLRRRHHQKQI